MKNLNQNFRLVLTDDDTEDCEMFNEALKMVDTNVTLEVLHNGQELLDHLHENCSELPNLVFLDLNMPIMDGIETVEAIRNDDKLKHISVVIFSTSSREEDIEQTYCKGANGFICKPSNFTKLQEIIKKALEINWNRQRTGNGQLTREQYYLTF
ncbi:response regulator [Flavobacterium soli]|uniref:response regulator n=1 Tax=Flavobacterium soli TaxID=344881 RepID=UPI00040F0A60|nr:response regulator [Flavobacterium soli]